MTFQNVLISNLVVNPANDRHGEMRDESAAMDELFRMHEPRMKALTKDIVEKARIYDAPLVILHDDNYVVFDGNRRVTCLKLLREPQLAPNPELTQFFREERQRWEGRFPARISCQVETDRDAIDDILSRRHTGAQGGIGQISWDDRAKHNFVERTGRGGRKNISAEIEQFLTESNRLPDERIPWSTLSRLLSSEQFRSRVGVSLANQTFRLTHQPEAVLDALERITTDLATGRLTLGHLWNNEGKVRYLNELEAEAALPQEQDRLEEPEAREGVAAGRNGRGRPARPPTPSPTFIPREVAAPQWTHDQHRIARVWEELASLPIRRFPNATAALVRMLVELSIENYLERHDINQEANLSRKVGLVSNSLRNRGLMDGGYYGEIERIRMNDELISIRSMQRLLHSPDFAPSEQEFRTYWSRLGRLLVAAVSQ